MSVKLTITLDDEVAAWLRTFAGERTMSMGEVVRIEIEALHQNDMACKAVRQLADVPLEPAG